MDSSWLDWAAVALLGGVVGASELVSRYKVGPSGFLQIFLTAADRAVDRKRATARSKAVTEVMKGIDFEKASKALPPYCVALMQSVSREDQQALGVDVLTTAVGSLGDQIRSVPEA
jgi:hypothetical protein